MKKALSFSAIIIGFTALASQIVLMREFLIVFYGNEISIGFILSGWLFWGAVGSWFSGKISDKIKFKINIFSFLQLALSVLLPLTLLAIRSIKPFLNIATGEMVAFFPMAMSSFVILAFVCALLGFMFSLACRIYEDKSLISATKIGKVYVLEAVGSILGGLMASFLLIRFLPSLHIMGIFSILNIIAAFSLQIFSKEVRSKAAVLVITTTLFICAVSLWLFKGWDNLNRYSLNKQWKGYRLLTSVNSLYGNIAVTKEDNQISFYDNGLHLYSVPDKLISEQSVHFALLEHPRPEEVLIIGGGVGGLLEEVLKHPVRTIDYIELDPMIIRLAEIYLDKSDYLYLQNPRVTIKNLDGRFFIKRTNKLYDCVIIHLGDPYTAQLNRYYTVEFFQEIKRILKAGGVISFAVTSAENYISAELGDFLRSIYISLKNVFEDVLVIPGETAYFLACTKNGVLTYDYRILMQRVQERNIEIKYVREYYLFSILSPERVSYMENSLKRSSNIGINQDFHPVTYYYNMIFWGSYFRGSLLKKILKYLTEDKVWGLIWGIFAFIIFWGMIKNKKGSLNNNSVLIAVMTTGFAEIAFQIVVLLSFQIIYGYVFYKLGLILTSFMIGLVLGSWWIIKIMPNLKKDLNLFIWTQVSICIYPLMLPLFFWWLSGNKTEITYWLGSNILFPFLPIVAGFIGGFQFPLANKIYLAKQEDIGRVAGVSYSMDLFGSCLGALLTGAFLVPILGIYKTCVVLAMLNFAALILLLFYQKQLIINGGVKQ